MKKWIGTAEFKECWRSAFSDLALEFKASSEDASITSKQERTGSYWTYVNNPAPGIHLVAFEFQPHVAPIALQINVWVHENQRDVYNLLQAAPPPRAFEQELVAFYGRRPRDTWQAQLRKRGIELLGVSYKLQNASFLSDPQRAETELRNVGIHFADWLHAALNISVASRRKSGFRPLHTPEHENKDSSESHPAGARSLDQYKKSQVERTAIEKCCSHFESLGYRVVSVEKENVGWDLEAFRNGVTILIEVKGLSGKDLVIGLTPNEYRAFASCWDTYRLAVVTNSAL